MMKILALLIVCLQAGSLVQANLDMRAASMDGDQVSELSISPRARGQNYCDEYANLCRTVCAPHGFSAQEQCLLYTVTPEHFIIYLALCPCPQYRP